MDDKGIDFVACYYDIQVKSVRDFNYVFFRKEYFSPKTENAAVVILFDRHLQPNQLFVGHDYEPPKKSRSGADLSQRNHSLRIFSTKP